MIKAVWAEIRALWSSIPDPASIRGFFWVLVLVPLSIAGLRIWWHDGAVDLLDQVLGSVAGLVLISRLFTPVIRVEYQVWMSIALVLGFIASTVILSVLFYILISPVGMVMRLVGHDPLNKTFRSAEKTYWKRYDQRKPDSWKHQY